MRVLVCLDIFKLKRHGKKMGSRGTPGPPVATPLDFVVVIIFPYTKPDFEARNQPNLRLCWKPIDDNHSASLESVRADSVAALYAYNSSLFSALQTSYIVRALWLNIFDSYIVHYY